MDELLEREVDEIRLKQLHTCRHCGYTGTDLHLERNHVGGIGFVYGYYCNDGKACWRRWESSHDQS